MKKARVRKAPTNGGGGAADVNSVRQAFAKVDGSLQALAQAHQSEQKNWEAVQGGFYRNDIWLETFRLILMDLADQINLLCVAKGLEPAAVKFTSEGRLDVDAYHALAIRAVKESIEQQQAALKAAAEQPSPKPEEPVVFGGDQ